MTAVVSGVPAIVGTVFVVLSGSGAAAVAIVVTACAEDDQQRNWLRALH
jgi:hypothetical protein